MVERVGSVIADGRAATAFLTRLPVYRAAPGGSLDGIVLWFPAVGWGIGAATGGVAIGVGSRAGWMVGAATAVAFAVALTGALHVDGLADTTDALGATTREDALRIMRDSRIGAYGAVAIAASLLLRVSTIGRLAQASQWLEIAAAAALGRAAPVAASGWLGYARSGSGVGQLLTGTRPRARAGLVGLIAVGLASLSSGLGGAEAALVAAGVCAACVWQLRRWLGGLTGDAAGATVELTEIAVLVFFCVR
ncbi:MAG: adenosylcobinamide-GDP ribazoletransferase [Gaiellaceae bacterium]